MTRAPFEAQRSTGLILFLKTGDSTRPMTLFALEPAARCSGQRKGLRRILFHLEQKNAGGHVARISGIAFDLSADSDAAKWRSASKTQSKSICAPFSHYIKNLL